MLPYGVRLSFLKFVFQYLFLSFILLVRMVTLLMTLGSMRAVCLTAVLLRYLHLAS